MDSSTVVAFAHPTLRSAAIGMHAFISGWMVLNGVAHQVGIIWKAQHGTLRHDANVTSLLAIGMGLIAAGAVLSWGVGPLLRLGAPSVLPALLGVAVLGGVIAAVAMGYGFTFLMGSITLGTLDLCLLLAHRVANA